MESYEVEVDGKVLPGTPDPPLNPLPCLSNANSPIAQSNQSEILLDTLFILMLFMEANLFPS